MADSNLPPPTPSHLLQLIEETGLPCDHPDSIFVMNELKSSAAVDFQEHSIKLATHAAVHFRGNHAVEVAAAAAAQVWESKDELLLYFKRTIVAMADVTGVDEISVSFALQCNMGCVVGALKHLVSSHGATHAQTSAQSLMSCGLMTADCSDTLLCCPSCSFVVCSACHLHSVQDVSRFPMLDDFPTKERFSQEGVQQSFAFFAAPTLRAAVCCRGNFGKR